MKRSVPAHPHALAARADRRAAAIAMGIDEAFIAALVDRFYAAIRTDAQLGPIFDERIDDWPAHLGQMTRFWQSILLGASNFTGNPMMKHLAIPAIGERHFQHWLALFYQTLRDIAPTEGAAELIGARARMIAESLLSGIIIHRDRNAGLAGDIDLPAFALADAGR